jgi:apolipoprotein N-acyltransferase
VKRTLIQFAIAGLSGLLLASLWAPFSQSGNVWFALVPLLLLLRGEITLKRAFGLGWFTGMISWCVQLSWMFCLTDNGGPWPLVVPALLGLSAVLSLYVGLFAIVAVIARRYLSKFDAVGRIAAVAVVEPMLWAATECLRATLFTGFAWNPLALASVHMLPVAQLAAVGGSCAVSAVLVAVNGAIASILERFWQNITHTGPTTWRDKFLRSVESSLPFVILLMLFLMGYARMAAYDKTPKTRNAVIAVQHTTAPCIFQQKTIPQPIWIAERETASLLPFFKADLWLWPESAVVGYYFPDPVAQWSLREFARTADTPLLVGGMYQRPDQKWYNAAMLITQDGLDTKQVYGKRHLVPFGEYIPFDKTFPWLQKFCPTGASCEPGDTVQMIQTPSGLKVGPLICFEDTVASVARESVLAGAEILVNMSNDAWYADSAEPAQHAQQAILRCIETGVPMMRSTNQGVNTVIDAVGRVHVIEKGSFPSRAPITEKPFAGAYLQWGELVFGAPCVLLLLGILFAVAMPRGMAKKVAAMLIVGFTLCFPSVSFATETLLPVAEMAIDDGNMSLAERAAQKIVASLGLSPEERARAEEILIRVALKQGAWDEALTRINACPYLSAERRLVFILAALTGKKDYAQVLIIYDESIVSTDTIWGVTALRYSLLAAQELGKKLLAAERFNAIQNAPGATETIKAENALEWDAYSPNEASRKALLTAAEKADQGGVYLKCALALPKAFATSDSASALGCIKRLLALKGLSSVIDAQLSLVAAELSKDTPEKITFARRAVKMARETEVRQKALSTLGGLLCSEEATFEEGLSYLNQAVALNPSAAVAPNIQLQIAEVLHAHRRTDEALKAYNRYLESYNLPALAVNVRQGKGRLLVMMERYDEALAAFLEASRFASTPDQRASLLLEAADAAAAAKRYPRAIELYRQLIRDGARAGIPLRLARCLEDYGQENAAIKEYQAIRDDAFASEQDVQMAVLRLGGIHCKAKRYTEAIAEYTVALQRLKQLELIAQVHLERGRTYYRIDNLPSALADFREVEESNSLSAEEARFFLVLCLYRLGDDAQARVLAEQYVQFYPNSIRIPDVALWIAKSDFNRGDYAAAQEEFISFAKRWPKEVRVANALYLAARSAYQNQNYSATVELVSQLAQQVPESEFIPNARFLQAEALVEQARHAEARDLLNALIRRYPNADWIAEAYGLQGDCLVYTAIDDPERYTLALNSYQEAVLRVEEDLDVSLKYLFRIGRVLERQNQRDEAAEQYTRLIYRVLNCPEISADGRQWFQKSLTRLHTIEAARGNLEAFDQLLYRVQRAQIQGLEYPID